MHWYFSLINRRPRRPLFLSLFFFPLGKKKEREGRLMRSYTDSFSTSKTYLLSDTFLDRFAGRLDYSLFGTSHTTTALRAQSVPAPLPTL